MVAVVSGVVMSAKWFEAKKSGMAWLVPEESDEKGNKEPVKVWLKSPVSVGEVVSLKVSCFVDEVNEIEGTRK